MENSHLMETNCAEIREQELQKLNNIVKKVRTERLVTEISSLFLLYVPSCNYLSEPVHIHLVYIE